MTNEDETSIVPSADISLLQRFSIGASGASDEALVEWSKMVDQLQDRIRREQFIRMKRNLQPKLDRLRHLGRNFPHDTSMSRAEAIEVLREWRSEMALLEAEVRPILGLVEDLELEPYDEGLIWREKFYGSMETCRACSFEDRVENNEFFVLEHQPSWQEYAGARVEPEIFTIACIRCGDVQSGRGQKICGVDAVGQPLHANMTTREVASMFEEYD